MIFAPVIRRAAYAQTPRAADLALQRFLTGTLAQQGVQRAAPSHPAEPAQFKVTQDDKSTTLQIDVPGLTREQLHIAIEGAVVRLNSVEGAPRHVQRAWELTDEVDAAASSATLENGVLTLTLARAVPVSKATTLAIG